MAAGGHCVIIDADCHDFLHVHPTEEVGDDDDDVAHRVLARRVSWRGGGPSVSFMANFPKPGLYTAATTAVFMNARWNTLFSASIKGTALSLLSGETKSREQRYYCAFCQKMFVSKNLPPIMKSIMCQTSETFLLLLLRLVDDVLVTSAMLY
jgi:hypothetical protein